MVTPPTGIALQTLVPAAGIGASPPAAAAPVTGLDSYQLAAPHGPAGGCPGTPLSKPRVTAGRVVADMVKEESIEHTLSGGYAMISRADSPPAEGEILPDEDAMSVICERLLQFHTRIDLNQQFARRAGIPDGTGFESIYKKGGEFWTYPGFFHDCQSLRRAVWRLKDECSIDIISCAGEHARRTGERSESEITRDLEKAWRLLCLALNHQRDKFDIPFDTPRDLIDVHFPPSGEARRTFNLKMRAYLKGTDLEDDGVFTATVQLIDFLRADLDEECEETVASEFEEYHFALSKFLRDLADIGIVVAMTQRQIEYLAKINEASLRQTGRKRKQAHPFGVHVPGPARDGPKTGAGKS